MKDCLFCRLVSREIPSTPVYEDEEILAFKDINPQAPIHLLVIPKKHVPSLSQTGPEDLGLLGKIHGVIQELAAEHGVATSGFRVVVNTGDDGGQTVGHLHFHLLGGRALKWPPG